MQNPKNEQSVSNSTQSLEKPNQHPDTLPLSLSMPTNNNRPFARVGIWGQMDKASVKQTVNDLVMLLGLHAYQVLVDETTAQCLSDELINKNRIDTPLCNVSDKALADNSNDKRLTSSAVSIVTGDCLMIYSDILVVVGGDGSILQAARQACDSGTPILGVNRGRLGFLADVYPDQLTQVLDVLSGAYESDERFLLSLQIKQDGVVLYRDVALNDIVLHAGKSVHTIDFEMSVNGVDVYRQHADGLIVATPTGSTAYNLSAGGPIIHPSLSAICLSPMYPHTLSSRPILVADTSRIELRVHKDNRTLPMVSSDGRASVPLAPNQVLQIDKYHKSLTLLHPRGLDFYAACRTKLHWSLYGDEFSLTKKLSQ